EIHERSIHTVESLHRISKRSERKTKIGRAVSSDGREVVSVMEDLGRILVVLTVSDRLGLGEKRRIAVGPLLHHDRGAFCAVRAMRLGAEERCERDQIADQAA